MLSDRSNGNPIRVCFVSHSAYMGGAERALLEAIRSLTNGGIKCRVLLPYKGPLCEELSKLNVDFRVVKYQPWVHSGNISWWRRMNSVLISLIMVIPAAVTIIRWRSGIVYTNTITVFTGAVAAFLTGRPHIWHIHEFLNEDHGLKFMFGKNLSLGLIGRLSAKCIIASKSIADALQGFIPSSKMKVIYQSVSISSSVMPMQKKSSAFKCLLVGKISEGKNQEEAVRAVAEVAKNGMAIELYLIGDGYEDYIAHLNNIIEQEGVRHNIRFMGYQNDAFSHMCIADVVLMCSRSEGFGRVTVEGMLAGKVVIGSRSGATPELIQDGVTGLLYTLGDYKDLANKIQYLHDHSAQVSLMGKNAQEWAVRNFSEERYGMDLMQVFLNITKSDDRHNKSSIKENSKD